MNLFENLQKMKEYNEDNSFGHQMKNFKFKCKKCGKEFIDKYDCPLPVDCGAAVRCSDCGGVASIMNNNPIEESTDEEESGLKVCKHCLDAIISREGKQNVVNTYTNYDWDEDAEPLICDWCEDEVDELYEIDNTKDLNEALYGGAFDITDDQYFTRDDLDEFANYVMEEVSKLSKYDWIPDLVDIYLEDNQSLEMSIECNNYEYTYSRDIDMRRIKTPRDLITKYASEYITYFYNEIEKNEEADWND